MKCENCNLEFETNEGKVFDNEKFVCFDCQDELATQTINWSIRK